MCSAKDSNAQLFSCSELGFDTAASLSRPSSWVLLESSSEVKENHAENGHARFYYSEFKMMQCAVECWFQFLRN